MRQPVNATSVLRTMVQPSWAALLRLIYPPLCIGCGTPLAEGIQPLCHRCMQRPERPSSEQLTAVLDALPEAGSALDAAFALWLFDAGGTMQRVQHRLKYGNRPRYGVALGRLVGAGYRDAGFPTPSLVLPVPLHRTRLYERGYNQSAMLARGVAEALAVPHRDDLLLRRRATRSQTHLSRQRRWKNVSGAFALADPIAIAASRVLLIDDVLTTGATLAAAATVLRTAGVTSVHAATLALAR